MPRSLYFFSIGLVFTVSLAACRPTHSDQPSGYLVAAIESYPLQLDPRYATDANGVRIGNLIYNSLLRADSQSRLRPELAESLRLLDDRIEGTESLLAKIIEAPASSETLSYDISGGVAEVILAVSEALSFLDQALDAGFRPGLGNVVPDRFFWALPEAEPGEEGEPLGETAPEEDAAAAERGPRRVH